VELVGLLAPDPGLDRLTVLEPVHQYVEAVEVLAFHGRRGVLQRHGVLVIAQGMNELSLERASGRLGQLHEVRENGVPPPIVPGDRKSTRLNSSHRTISYAVFCLTKKRQKRN